MCVHHGHRKTRRIHSPESLPPFLIRHFVSLATLRDIEDGMLGCSDAACCAVGDASVLKVLMVLKRTIQREMICLMCTLCLAGVHILCVRQPQHSTMWAQHCNICRCSNLISFHAIHQLKLSFCCMHAACVSFTFQSPS